MTLPYPLRIPRLACIATLRLRFMRLSLCCMSLCTCHNHCPCLSPSRRGAAQRSPESVGVRNPHLPMTVIARRCGCFRRWRLRWYLMPFPLLLSLSRMRARQLLSSPTTCRVLCGGVVQLCPVHAHTHHCDCAAAHLPPPRGRSRCACACWHWALVVGGVFFWCARPGAP